MHSFITKIVRNIAISALASAIMSLLIVAVFVLLESPRIYEIGVSAMLLIQFTIIWIVALIIVSIELYKSDLKRVIKVKETHDTSWIFAIENRDSSREFINFRLERPTGYAPWGIEEFLQYIRRPRGT